MTKQQKRICLILVAVALVAALCVLFFWLLPTVFDRYFTEAEIEAFLDGKTGWQGLALLGILQAVQVLSIFFPGMVVQIAGGLVFGEWRAFAVCLTVFTLTNVGVYLLARRSAQRLRRRHGQPMPKVQKVLDWINSSDPGFMCMLAYMMPGVPNGFVPYAAAHTEVSARQFALSVLCGSGIQIFLNCSIGSRIMSGDYAVSFGMTIGSLALIALLYKNKDWLIALRAHRTNRDGADTPKN